MNLVPFCFWEVLLKYHTFEEDFFVFMGKTNTKLDSVHCRVCIKKFIRIKVKNCQFQLQSVLFEAKAYTINGVCQSIKSVFILFGIYNFDVPVNAFSIFCEDLSSMQFLAVCMAPVSALRPQLPCHILSLYCTFPSEKMGSLVSLNESQLSILDLQISVHFMLTYPFFILL